VERDASGANAVANALLDKKDLLEDKFFIV
jgi:hypothetical protein